MLLCDLITAFIGFSDWYSDYLFLRPGSKLIFSSYLLEFTFISGFLFKTPKELTEKIEFVLRA